MPVQTLPNVDLLAGWQALQADGVTPSTTLTVAQDSTTPTPSGDTRSVRIDLTTGALNHIARRSGAAQDLSQHDELRLVAGTDSPVAHPPVLELRLGSAALAIGAPGNTWHRRLPPMTAGWELIRFSLDDLPAAVRGALTVIELRCVDDARDVRLRIDEALAVRSAMVFDTEQALLNRLHNQLVLNAAPVPALLTVAGAVLPAAPWPCIVIMSLGLRLAQERSTGQARRCDFTSTGYRLRPAPAAYEVIFGLEPLAATRTEQSAITDWLLWALPVQGTLRVGGQALSFEQLTDSPVRLEVPFVRVPRQWLTCRAWAWRETGPTTPVRPAEDLITTVDWKEPVNV
jgi:hypothetical protein